jgi:uncharacterized protein (TIGR03083 family)
MPVPWGVCYWKHWRVSEREEYEMRLGALARTWRVWTRTGAALSDAQWRQPTRCGRWDVRALYAHHSVFPAALAALPQAAAPAADPVAASDVLRAFNAPDGVAVVHADVIARHALSQAAGDPAEVFVERFRAGGPAAVEVLRAADPAAPVRWTTFAVTLNEVLRIAVMEASVHLLDLQRALGQLPEVPADALALTVRLLAEVAPAVEFIEAATGRTETMPLPVIR